MKSEYSETNGLIRVYTEGHDYKKRSLFVGVVSVFWIDDKTAFLFGALTNATDNTKRDLLPVFDQLIKRGATKAQMKRSKGHKMPFGRIVASDEFEDMWEVDFLELNGFFI
ncbi:MAG: hypothetical protein GQ532_00330 [Methylomarinum sp.]|nr:hypothetical protein [Methylomarinum sp.]